MTEKEHFRTVEINGIKMEVDLRTAKRVDSYRIGDKVKILTKAYSGYESHPGVIVGFDEFKNRPTIVVAYVKIDHSNDGAVHFAYIHEGNGDIEIVALNSDDLIPTRETVVATFDRLIAKKKLELADLDAKRSYFLERFGAAFAEYATAPTPAT